MQIIEIALSGTQIHHIQECTFRSCDCDIVLLFDTDYVGPEHRIDLAEHVRLAIYLHGARQVADTSDVFGVLECDSGTCQDVLE